MRTITRSPNATEIEFDGQPVGLLIPQDLENSGRSLRFSVTDYRYRILDGSSFPNVGLAQRAVRQLAHFVAHDKPANDA